MSYNYHRARLQRAAMRNQMALDRLAYLEQGLAPILQQQMSHKASGYGPWDAVKYAMPGFAFGTKVMMGLDEKIGTRKRIPTYEEKITPVLEKPRLRGSIKTQPQEKMELFSAGYGKSSGKKNPYITIVQYERKNRTRKSRRKLKRN